ncbi:hypothetical protein DAPPUDRAFT_316374 [Daphnia pulex]|uniref:Sulfotransferase domain-containing protein n=1 Tax=Daphnia pulex TaxID=6669 RepID=E9GCQ0_DAPPU|nr:hypothetical protein DAPPUDRAFT_316374 [Daphnia pulex]|eukprot:EFX82596.1 hypothetical protein DAPPUDRAFT_316374 [Daphnia pulex]
MALVSYPGSGNTWTRGIIERLSGYFTGRFYGEIMPVDCGCTVVQKTHDFQKYDYKPFVNKSALLIIRNPYKALVSYRNFLTTGNNQTASASLTQFTGPDLLQDKENQFRQLMRYLGLEVDERRLDCVIKHDFSSFKRNSTRSTRNETIRDPFNSVLRGIVDKEIQIVQKALTDYGYELKLTKE